MNPVDKVVEFFYPRAAVRREAARNVLGEIRAAYDAAGFGRRTANWKGSNASANVATKGSLTELRKRSHDVVRNTWWGPRIVSTVKSHAVGTGITPVFKTGNKALDRRAAAEFKRWGKACDFEGQLDINGLQALSVGTIAESGEVLVRMVPVAPRQKLRVPIELQLLEPDHLDQSRDRIGSVSVVDQGIEYDAEGKRAAYWLLPEHPGQRGLTGRTASIRIPASEVLHVYRKDRVGQGRGVPWMAPVLLKGKDIADLEEAINVKARVEACLAAIVRGSETARTLAQARTERKSDGSERRLETLSPGMVAYIDSSEEVSVVNPSSSLAFERVLMQAWMTLAAGSGITYDQLTGDLRQANYSSMRAGKIEFRRMIEQFQWLTLAAMMLDPLIERWAALAQDAGVLPRRASGYPFELIMPAVEPINPIDDMQADILAVRTGRMTWAQFVGAWGVDPDAQLDEIEAWLKDIDARGVFLDCDPRRAFKGVSAAGDQPGGSKNDQSSQDQNNPEGNGNAGR